MIGEFCPKVFALNIYRGFGLKNFGNGGFFQWCRGSGAGRHPPRLLADIHSPRRLLYPVSKWNFFPLLSAT
jgi:hypothetical protein